MRASRPAVGRRRSLRERRPRGSAPGAGSRPLRKFSAAGRKATAAAERRAGPSASLPLLCDAQSHRRRRGAWHPAPRRSQRRSTPFFSRLLAHGQKGSFPADPGEEPEKTTKSSAGAGTLRRQGPINEERPSFDVAGRDRSPEPAVVRVIPVVPEREIRAGGHGRRGNLIALAVRGRKKRIVGANEAVGMEHTRLALPGAIDEELLVPDRDHVSGQCHNALDEVALRAGGVLEHEDVAAANGPVGQQAIERSTRVRPEDELVDEDVVADEDRLLHRRGGHFESLNQERADVEREDDRDARGFEQLTPARAPRKLRRRRRAYWTIENIRSHRVRVKMWIATSRSCRILSTKPRQM